MGYKNNYIQDINDKLMTKRTPDDIQSKLNIPEHKFKKISEKFNHALREVYNEHSENEVLMFHILLSLQEYFDMEWLVKNVLDDDNEAIVLGEMSREYNITRSKKRPKKKEVKKAKRVYKKRAEKPVEKEVPAKKVTKKKSTKKKCAKKVAKKKNAKKN